MHLESERLKSFENWPFDESCKCTPATGPCHYPRKYTINV